MTGKVTALLLAAGRGERLLLSQNKIFAQIGGKTVLWRSLSTLCGEDGIDEVIVAAAADELSAVRAVCAPFAKVVSVVSGGASRQDSVAAAFKEISGDCDLLLVHDAARALLSPADLRRVLEAGAKNGAAVLVAPAKDTVKLLDKNGMIEATPSRDRLVLAQTPQVFAYELYAAALAKAERELFTSTDDASLVENMGVKVFPVIALDENFKLTTPEDLTLMELILAKRGDSL